MVNLSFCAPRRWRHLIHRDEHCLPQLYRRFRVCMGDFQSDGLVSIFPVRSVSKTSSPNDDIHPQVPFRCERFTALHLVWNSEPLQSAGDRVEKWLVLVHLRSSSGTDACVPGATLIALQQRHLTATCSSILGSAFPCPRTLLRV